VKVPPRGEVWLVDLGLAAKVRPCLVLSVPPDGEERVLVCVVPHTTSTRSSRFEVSSATRFLKPGAFDAQGLVTIPAVRLVRKLGSVDQEQLAQIEMAVLRWLGISGTAHLPSESD
jgi:mRNA interferase MazF